MADSISKNLFPSQVVSDLEKASLEYGLKIGKAIESEWLDTESGANRFKSNETSYHRLRLYARGAVSYTHLTLPTIYSV